MKVTFPDGKTVEVKDGMTPYEIVLSKIGEGLARAAVVAKINGELWDMNRPVTQNCKLEVLKYEDPEGKDVFWHSSTHLMAHAVKELFPESKLTIGPVVDEGFYYDIDHPPFTLDDLKKIEEKMKEIVSRKLEVTRLELTKEQALKMFNDNPYKTEIIKETEDPKITAYQQGDFIDLCRGPHVSNTSRIKAFKLTKLAGAYWRGDPKRAQLQRIYGISFPEKDQLKEYLSKIEEAEKRDHRKIGKDLDLYSFLEESPGCTFFHPKGATVYNELLKFLREQYIKRGYKEVITPLLYNKSLWETSGHWQHYRENMFSMEIEGQTFSLKPMNCPSHILIYKTSTRSYKDLPLRIADFAPLHRNELSGVLTGLTRVRKMSQDDGHIFCAPEQIREEIKKLMDFVLYVFKDTFKMEIIFNLSTRPEGRLGNDKLWDDAEDALRTALTESNVDYIVKEGEGAFYGPKIDFDVKDALGRKWQLATIQLDFQLPQRFNATYEGQDGKKHPVVMIHRAILGSLERFIGVYVEHTAGKFPLWLSPVQVMVLPIADRHNDYCEDIVSEMKTIGIRAEFDCAHETLNRKVRNAQLQQINYILVVGDKEQDNKTVNVRTRDNEVHGEKKIDDFMKEVLKETKDRR